MPDENTRGAGRAERAGGAERAERAERRGVPALTAATALLLVLPPLFWAGNAVVARALVGLVPPLALSWGRWALALAILLPFAWRGLVAERALVRAHWRDIAWMGVLGVGCYNTFQYLALQTSTVLNVTLISASSPVFALVIGRLFFRAPVGALQWGGAAVSLTGVAWVLARGEAANLASFAFTPGDLIMLVANLTWTLYTWLLRVRRPQLSFRPFLALQMVAGTAVITPFFALEAAGALGAGAAGAPGAAPSIAWSAATIAAFAYVALLPSIAAYWCWDRGVARVGAVLPVYFANLTPVFAGVLATLLLGEAPHVFHGIGLVLIVGGIHLASRQPR
jgi:drug/metabolite transporter (DMT)-like permease